MGKFAFTIVLALIITVVVFVLNLVRGLRGNKEAASRSRRIGGCLIALVVIAIIIIVVLDLLVGMIFPDADTWF